MKNNHRKSEIIKELQTLYNIGPAIARRLYTIGFRTLEQVKKSDPEKVYERLRVKEGGKLDKCVLYVLRGAILDIPWWECKDIKIGAGNKRSKERCLKKKN